PGRWSPGPGSPRAVVPLRGDEPAVPGQQRAGRDREYRPPAVTGYQTRQRSRPEPILRLVADRAGDLTAQHRILVPEHEQLGILRGVAAQKRPGDGQQPADHLVKQRDDHRDMVPAETGPPLPPAAMTFRARQGSPPSASESAAANCSFERAAVG